jgi:hypothetical protein
VIQSLEVRGPDLLVNGTPRRDLWGENTWFELQNHSGLPPLDIRPRRIRQGQTYARGWLIFQTVEPHWQSQAFYDAQRAWVRENNRAGIVSSVMGFQSYDFTPGAPPSYPNAPSAETRAHMRKIANSLRNYAYIFEPANEQRSASYLRDMVEYWVTLSDRPVLLSAGRSNLTEADLTWAAQPAAGNFLVAVNGTMVAGPRAYPVIADTDHMAKAVLHGTPPQARIDGLEDWMPHATAYSEIRAFEGSALVSNSTPANDPDNPANPLFIGWAQGHFGGGEPVPPPQEIDLVDWMVPEDLEAYPRCRAISTWPIGDRICYAKGMTDPENQATAKWDWFAYDSTDVILLATTDSPLDDPTAYKDLMKKRAWPRTIRAGTPFYASPERRLKYNRLRNCSLYETLDLGPYERFSVYAFAQASDPDGSGVPIGGFVPDDAWTVLCEHYWGDNGRQADNLEQFIFCRPYGWVRWNHRRWDGSKWALDPADQVTFDRVLQSRAAPLFPCMPAWLDPTYLMYPPPPPPPRDPDEIVEDIFAATGDKTPASTCVLGCDRPSGQYKKVRVLVNELRALVP